MKLRFYFLFAFFSLLFLFYPGETEYFNTFAYNRPLFAQKKSESKVNIAPIPAVKSPFYPEISAEGVYVVDALSFTPVLERNARQKFLPASTTKIITALVAYDIYSVDEILTVKQITGDGQVMGLVPGERITVENIIRGTLIHSGNDAAFVLADNFGLQKFISLMNKKAEDLKMRDTHFKNPTGYDEVEQFTTPYDLALAARELLSHKYLSKIVSIKEIIISDVDFKYFHTLTNVNKLLGEISGIGGLKTGYTESAGENLVSLYKKSDSHDFIIVILKSDDRFEDTKAVVDWIENNIEYITL